ncbi:hypothetical protein AMTRI_Chr05g59640 [Amborella trichopoda]|uniref:Phosphorylated adapter RNA export protein n=1 Tax=Amborella trichopoda TaxID=13333 RepID=U5CYX2_AMBTC|nr:uncharacterized protein LOC18443668 [Amborella trichopoda]ERN15379.1 hypothetical protein AMTR_s00036p00184370 [Amborella trichopoda]|eukprot:XP_006853912.1 uncharacterized protein LOC18443668 [Amborella trichopoda]
MEEGECILDTLFEEEGDDVHDVDMVDAEDQRHLQEKDSHGDYGDDVHGGSVPSKQVPAKNTGELKVRKKRKKNKKKRSNSGIADINRFVTNTCRHLGEKKSYLFWEAISCLGLSVLTDLIKEVDVIQDCGGQLTADGGRPRTGGGILWNIIKARHPTAYKEIVARGKEVEKQFRHQGNNRLATKVINEPIKSDTQIPDKGSPGKVMQGSSKCDEVQPILTTGCESQERHKSVWERIRVPVSYDDLLDGENEAGF